MELYALFLVFLLSTFHSLVNGYKGWGFHSPGNAMAAMLDISSLEANAMNCSSYYIGDQSGKMEADKVGRLPGQPDTSSKFDQYAGYVTVDADAGAALFYYFVEAPEEAASKPLVLWFTGGGNWDAHPSSGYGAMFGQGPFRVVNSHGPKLVLNDYAWNNVANIIFLDSPIGVGYSYSNQTKTDVALGETKAGAIGDRGTYENSFTFLINWLERFPQYKNRRFYIAGDGYAGHVVSQLAYKIFLNNQKCTETHINLQAVAIGNGWMDEEIFLEGVYDYYWMRNLMSTEMHEGIKAECNFSVPIYLSPSCLDYISDAAELVENINPHDIYSPPCDNNPQDLISAKTFTPCSYLFLETYFNREDVKKALHVNNPWTTGSSLAAVWTDWYPSTTPIIKQLMGNNISVWLYSGDTDGVVPITSTQYFIDNLQLPKLTPFYPWYSGGQVAGFAVAYENLTFVHVHHGGHYVPSYQPAQALTLFSSFLKGVMPPNSP